MNRQRRIALAGSVLALVGLAVAPGCQPIAQVAVRKLTRDPMKPRSDVRVVESYPQDVEITDLSVGIVKANLSVFDDRALIRFRIAGTLRHGQRGRRPFLKEVQISEHLPEGDEDANRLGEIILVPVVGVKRDGKYEGEQLPFDVKLEHVVRTFQTLENKYVVRCGGLERELVLFWHKSGRPQGSSPWCSEAETTTVGQGS